MTDSSVLFVCISYAFCLGAAYLSMLSMKSPPIYAKYEITETKKILINKNNTHFTKIVIPALNPFA